METQPLLTSEFLQRIDMLTLALNPIRRTPTAGMVGEHNSQRKAHAVEFADYRAYVPGDDLRLIDWNVYARLGELCLRLAQAQENVRLHLLFDTSASMAWGSPSKFEAAKRFLAAVGAVALHRYDSVSLATFNQRLGQVFPPIRGKTQVHDLLHALNSLVPAGTTDLAAGVAAYRARETPYGVGILISDFLVTTGIEDALRYLSSNHLDLTVIHILAPDDITPSLTGSLQLVDAESQETVAITVTPEKLQKYERQVTAWRASIEALCIRFGARYLPISTNQSVEDLVLTTLRREGILT